jgi:hypothetical protein
MNNSEAEMFLKRVEVLVTVEEGMPLGQTESGDQAVDGFANYMDTRSRSPIVLSGGHRQSLASLVEHLEVGQVTPDARKSPRILCRISHKIRSVKPRRC